MSFFFEHLSLKAKNNITFNIYFKKKPLNPQEEKRRKKQEEIQKEKIILNKIVNPTKPTYNQKIL